VAAEPQTEVRIGDGVGASIMDRVPLVMLTRTGASARFAAVLEPVAKDRKPAVTAVAAEETRGGVRIIVRNGDTVETVTLTADAHLTVTSGDKVVLTEAGGPR
jgi:nitrogen fixation protein